MNWFQDRWYRFQGEAGERLADIGGPPSWEECGTSRVGWLSGTHPTIRYFILDRLADIGGPPSWEECGTSRVGWLSGTHPAIRYFVPTGRHWRPA
jgi:hypothetical protein